MSIEQAIVRFFDKNLNVVGAGFFISSKHIITCAHVFALATTGNIMNSEIPELPDEEAEFDFPYLKSERLKAKAIYWYPLDRDKTKPVEDIAILELVSSLPSNADHATLLESQNTSNLKNRPFEVYGFPTGQPIGVWAKGIVINELSNGWMQIEAEGETGYSLEKGFSGAPVIDREKKEVIGMAIASDQKRESAKVSFFVPSRILIKTCSNLEEISYFNRSSELDAMEEHCLEVSSYINRSHIRGQVVVFLGSGINLCGREEKYPYLPSSWNPEGDYPPTLDELAAYLDTELTRGKHIRNTSCPLCELDEDKLPKNCPILTKKITKFPLEEIAQEILSSNVGIEVVSNTMKWIGKHHYKPNLAHSFFAKISRILDKKNIPQIIILTTNFDSTLEKAFKEEKQEFDLLSYIYSDIYGGHFIHQEFRLDSDGISLKRSKEVNLIQMDSEKYSPSRWSDRCEKSSVPIIIKLYGTPDWEDNSRGNFIITEDHFINYFVNRSIDNCLPKALLNNIRKGHIWFIGYELSHWIQRVALHRIWPKNGPFPIDPCWAIEENLGVFEQKIWENNNIKYKNFDLSAYFKKLHSIFAKEE